MKPSIELSNLRVDHLSNPLGLDNLYPAFSWQIRSDGQNIRQSAARIRVSLDLPSLLAGDGNVWDSGKLAGPDTLSVRYEGASLASRRRYYWSVEVWTDGKASAVSDPAWWETGLLVASDWSGDWLSGASQKDIAALRTERKWLWDRSDEVARTTIFRFRYHVRDAGLEADLYILTSAEFALRVTNLWVNGVLYPNRENATICRQWMVLRGLIAGSNELLVEVTRLAGAAFATERAGLCLFVSESDGIGKEARTISLNDGETRTIDEESWQPVEQFEIKGLLPWEPLPAKLFRTSFHLSRPVRSARLYITALGVYEPWINGQRASDTRLDPGPSQYRKRVHYQVVDITSHLRMGENVLAMQLGEGWYGGFVRPFAWGEPPCRILAQLDGVFEDGSPFSVATGPHWQCSTGPVRASQIRGGEFYDERFNRPGWNEPNFSDDQWSPCEIAPAPACSLIADPAPPIRALGTISAIGIVPLGAEAYLVDFGENFAGWCQMRVRGHRGDRVEILYAELLNAEGGVNQHFENIGQPKKDVFVLDGRPEPQVLEPRFSYRGFRYAEIRGLKEALVPEMIKGIVAHSDLKPVGELRLRDPLLCRMWDAARRTQRSNFVGIPTDCPSREQYGWTADAAGFWETAVYMVDTAAFGSRFLTAIGDDVAAQGYFPMLAPWPGGSEPTETGTPPAWGLAGLSVAWLHWRQYADPEPARRLWSALVRYLARIKEDNPDYIFRNGRGNDYGDWLAVDQANVNPEINPTSPRELIGTALWARALTMMAQLADALKKDGAASDFLADLSAIRSSFADEFLTPDGYLGPESQTVYLVTLAAGLVDGVLRDLIVEKLVSDIKARDGALSTGVVGTQFLLSVLADHGHVSLAHALLLRIEYPSWGFMIERGGTTLWENWRGTIAVDGEGELPLSRNHYWTGCFASFLFKRVAGIDSEEPGFKTIVIKPLPSSLVREAGGTFASPVGRISSDWRCLPEGLFELDIEIPANATAKVHVPPQFSEIIFESGKEFPSASEAKISEDGATVISVGSGLYKFQCWGQEGHSLV